METSELLGKTNYERYCHIVRTTWDGKPLPNWRGGDKELTEKIRQAWCEGAISVIKQYQRTLTFTRKREEDV